MSINNDTYKENHLINVLKGRYSSKGLINEMVGCLWDVKPEPKLPHMSVTRYQDKIRTHKNLWEDCFISCSCLHTQDILV